MSWGLAVRPAKYRSAWRADATGLTAVHTNRTLQALRKSGLIGLTASKLTILDWDALAEAGDFSERDLHHSV